jgi:hypothetical protein
MSTKLEEIKSLLEQQTSELQLESSDKFNYSTQLLRDHLLNKTVMFVGLNYIYHGKVVEVTNEFFMVTDHAIVFETGLLHEDGYDQVSRVPTDLWFVERKNLESWGITNKKNVLEDIKNRIEQYMKEKGQ